MKIYDIAEKSWFLPLYGERFAMGISSLVVLNVEYLELVICYTPLRSEPENPWPR
jgi:hypothetical protein